MMNQYGFLTIVAIVLIAGVSDALLPQKIVGGDTAALGEFPYQVSLRRFGKHACGGSIISSRLVLTARHCIYNRVEPPYTDLLVMTGSIEVTGGQNHTVKSVHYYNRYPAYHDIAIVELNEDIPFNNYQKAVGISPNPVSRGVTANVTGWGYLRFSLRQPSHNLQKLNVTITGPNNVNAITIDALGEPGTGACRADSGSPLVRNGYVIGIVSEAVPCARGVADTYVSVAHHYAWIQQLMIRELTMQ